MRSTSFAIAMLSVIATSAVGQGADPLIGTWKMNLEKSTSTLPPFKSATLAITGEGQNRTLTAEGVDANSQLFKVVYRHIYDGQPHPTTGSPDYDSSTYTRIGNTINIVRFRQGKAVEVGQGVIVPGQTYTVSVEGIDVNNQAYRSATVFDRQRSHGVAVTSWVVYPDNSARCGRSPPHCNYLIVLGLGRK
jgi:hypothetical protein